MSVKSVLLTSYSNTALLGLSFVSQLEAAENSRLEVSSMSLGRVLCDEAGPWSEDGVSADNK